MNDDICISQCWIICKVTYRTHIHVHPLIKSNAEIYMYIAIILYPSVSMSIVLSEPVLQMLQILDYKQNRKLHTAQTKINVIPLETMLPFLSLPHRFCQHNVQSYI